MTKRFAFAPGFATSQALQRREAREAGQDARSKARKADDDFKSA